MGAQLPEVPMYDLPTGNQNFKQGPRADELKLMILRLSLGEQTTKFLAHSALLKRKQKTFSPWP